MEKTGISVNLKVSQKSTLEMNDDETEAIFKEKSGRIYLKLAKNLTKEKEQAWREVARIVLLGPNYKKVKK